MPSPARALSVLSSPRPWALLLVLSSAACVGPGPGPTAIDVTQGPEAKREAPAKGSPGAPRKTSEGRALALSGYGAPPTIRPLKSWKDQSEGPLATFVYVTETGSRGRRRPAAIIFSSDPSHNFFRRTKSTPRFSLRRLYKSEMAGLLGELEGAGLSALPWRNEQDYDAKVESERGFHLWKPGAGKQQSRRFVFKNELGLDGKIAFRKVEDKVIALTMVR